MSRRALLWIAFVVVHVVVASLGFGLAGFPIGDVVLVYDPWSHRALNGGGVVGVTDEWVYPVLALVPMILAQALAPLVGYAIAWAVVVTALDAVAFAILVGRGRSRGRVAAAWFWLAFSLLLGPIGVYRLDAVTVPLAVLALLWLVRRPVLASALLAVAAWIKVWPGALLAAALLAARARLRILAGALATSAVVAAAVIVAGGAPHLFGFVTEQTGRGLQVEAPVSAIYLWQAVAGRPGAFVYYDEDILTYQVTGPGVDGVIAAMTPLLAVAVVAVAALGAVKALRGASFVRLFPPLALALVLVLIVFNKVGSPQFQVWLVAPLVFALAVDRRRWGGPALAALTSALLTFLIYPVFYGSLIEASALAVGLLTARNALLIALLAWCVVRLARVPVGPAAPLLTPSSDADRVTRS